MNRSTLHTLVDRIPEADVLPAQRFLEYLAVNPAYRAAQMAPPADENATSRAQADIEAGRVTHHEDILREFGVR